MYMGRKANPVANKLLFEVELKKKQDSHRKRIASIKSSLDTRPPPEHRHLYRNAKKEQLMEDRYARIEHENRLLLTKMSDIMTRRGDVDNVNASWQYGSSLNRTVRAKELRRITEDNLRILHRIQTVAPMYDHVKWGEDRARQERLVESICEFKSVRGRGSSVLAGGSSMYSARSRSMGALGAAGSLASGSSYDGGEVQMSFGGAGASVAAGGAVPTGSGAYHHHTGGGAALSTFHADAGLSSPTATYGAADMGGAAIHSLYSSAAGGGAGGPR